MHFNVSCVSVAGYPRRPSSAETSEAFTGRSPGWYNVSDGHLPTGPHQNKTECPAGDWPGEKVQVSSCMSVCVHTLLVPSYPRSIGHAFQTILKEEGGFWSGCLYRGIFPTLMGIAPYVGLNFAFYETLKGTGSVFFSLVCLTNRQLQALKYIS